VRKYAAGIVISIERLNSINLKKESFDDLRDVAPNFGLAVNRRLRLSASPLSLAVYVEPGCRDG
jgi:hypothetical protein